MSRDAQAMSRARLIRHRHLARETRGKRNKMRVFLCFNGVSQGAMLGPILFEERGLVNHLSKSDVISVQDLNDLKTESLTEIN